MAARLGGARADRVFLAERTERAGATADAGTPEGAPWRSVTYREALAQVMSAADWLLAEGLSPERPLVVLSDNGVDHALLGLAAMAVGIPYAPVSPAYSLMSSDHARLKAIIRLLSPGAIYVADPAPFESALAAIASLHDATQIRSAPSHREPGDLAPAARSASPNSWAGRRRPRPTPRNARSARIRSRRSSSRPGPPDPPTASRAC